MDPRDIIKISLCRFPNGNMYEVVIDIEGNNPVLSMDLLFCTIMFSNKIHLNTDLSVLWSLEKRVYSPFNELQLFDLDNDGTIGDIHGSLHWSNEDRLWL